MDRSHALLPRRVMLAFVGVELVFKGLVGYAFLDLAGARSPAERAASLAGYLCAALPFTVVFFIGLARALAPIRRWHRAVAAGRDDDQLLAQAGEALFQLPARAGWRWTFSWVGVTVVALATQKATCVEAAVMFLIAMMTGPYPIGSALGLWLTAPSVRHAAALARDRAITLHTASWPLRRRLSVFGMFVAIAPSTYIASFAFSAQVSRLSLGEMLVPVLVCCTAIAVFALICTSLMAASITDAVASMAEVIRTIARRGDVTRVERVPQQLRDEIGGLAMSTNEMIDRLERTAAERAALSESLEMLNHALERRVEERTTKLFEANAVLAAEMAARAKVEVELRQAQKLEAVGRLAAGIAHEINTPVQFVSDSVRFVADASSELIALIAKYQVAVRAVLSGVPPHEAARDAEHAEHAADLEYVVGEIPSALNRALEGLDRVSMIVRSMKVFAHHDQDMRDVDLNAAILSTLTIAHHEYKYVAEVDTDLGELPLVRCHVGEINQAVLNLLINAAHAIADVPRAAGDKGRIAIRTRADGDEAVIEISDTGSGVPENIRDRIFDPFFTTKDVNRGTGQGLAIARSVVADKHGGSLSFTSEVGKGSTFTIRLPIHGKRASQSSGMELGPHAPGFARSSLG